MRAAALLAVALLVAGCSGLSAAAAGSTVRHLGDRTYLLYIPDDLPPQAPLVVMLHGGFGSAAQAERTYGWDRLADTAKFAVAYPDGLGRAWNAGGGCCGRSATDGVDDVGFITSAVTDVARTVDIDPKRIYATGISNGGLMAYALACNASVFAAIGPDSATQLDPCPSPHPTSVLHIHGTADPRIRYDGGRGDGFVHIDGPPVQELNAFWRNVDQCAAPVVTVDGSVTTSAADCADGRGVTLMTVAGGGHEWPPFATERLWQFFAAHPAR
ncbi:lipoprotein lpqP [Mycolicibacterium canariasense]|uniref:Lipoprotein lpqP n=1 Tax=Mycolicibacterium canariasense TaxID=228230 RepID=A0A100WFD1_MYCCR|nr:PHB depolymerase family esterase [Mycolicibacterium canariasense]MCV7211246.1 polyhydroxybutyrate depolymerase [Mycolicibacterium canariasense]ORV03304.1 polyhydroxybutyrate depolymerase [Mycolicibacterium canariasense]GAS97181.1 lipoprotein lpqP [Mycolicibacterium canariasense]